MARRETDKKPEPWLYRFRDLMPFLVRKILLVSSPYDAFILEEDKPLTERLFAEYSELSMLISPQIVRADSPAQALALLKERHFELVITAPRLEGGDINTFGRQVKEIYPGTPVVLITFDESDLDSLPEVIDNRAIDEVFLWAGSSRIVFAIIKQIEDRINVAHDTEMGDVRVIVLVENSARDYSVVLATLYSEIMMQSQALMADTSNSLKKMLRLRSRPKVLLAKTFDEAITFLEQFSDNLMGVISDVRFPKDGVEVKDAGFKLAEWIRKRKPNIPIMLQSRDTQPSKRIEELNVRYVSKNSKDLLWQVRKFLKKELGFGPFVFRYPNGQTIDRAKNLKEMEAILRRLPAESLSYHGQKNDFSRWLNARSMFALSRQVRAHATQLDNIEESRRVLINIIHKAREHEHEGCVADFSRHQSPGESRFVRLGSGSMGGKGRGIAFVYSLLTGGEVFAKVEGLDLRVPKTLVIGTDEYDRFMQSNSLFDKLHAFSDDKDTRRIFLRGHFPRNLIRDLRIASGEFKGPLAVRSSGLLEDSHFMPFAGVYSTYLLPNNDPNPDVRFMELRRAIKAVYSSTFRKTARSFITSTPYRIEDEKMGIIVQEVVGRQYEQRFYPHCSGVAISYNYYPIASQKPEDGVAMIALGLGKTVVEGGKASRFSPGAPGVTMPYSSAWEQVCNSQAKFYAIDLSETTRDFLGHSEDFCFRQYDLGASEEDGTLAQVGSVYCVADDVIRDNLNLPGPRVVTFNNILKWKSLPLATGLKQLLDIMRSAMGCEVEIEFALDLGSPGENVTPVLYVLQIRPLAGRHVFREKVEPQAFPKERILFSTNRSLGNGIIKNIYDIVMVRPEAFNTTDRATIASEIEVLTERLRIEKAPFILVGPGRWGTMDPSLGIPVQWGQIAGVKILVETGLKDRAVEPSDGTHFFQNITSLGIGQLTIATMEQTDDLEKFIDFKWLDSQRAFAKSKHAQHLRFSKPLACYLEGARGNAVILKPEGM